MVRSSIRAKLLSAAVVLSLPLAYLVLAELVTNEILPLAGVRPLLNSLGLVAGFDLLLVGPVGLILLARAFGRRGGEVVVFVLLLLPVFVVVWFISVASLSGALGNPL